MIEIIPILTFTIIAILSWRRYKDTRNSVPLAFHYIALICLWLYAWVAVFRLILSNLKPA